MQAVANSSIQSALEALRERWLVWHSARGDYALEDQGLADWLKECRAEKAAARSILRRSRS